MYQNGGGFLNATQDEGDREHVGERNGAVTQYFGWIKIGLAQTPAQLGAGWCGEALGKEKASIIFEGNWVTAT